MGVLQKILKKTQRLLWKLYAGIAKHIIKTQRQSWIDMRVLQEMPNKPTGIMGLICGYCIFENLLMRFIIENDVGVICLKCVHYFKNFQVM